MKIRLIAIILLIPLATLAAAGCRTTGTKQEELQRRQWEDRLSTQVLELEERMMELETDLAVFRRNQTGIGRRIDGLAARLQKSETERAAETRDLKSRIRAVREEISKKLDVILEEVAKENERLLERLNASRQSSTYAQGYEHVVRGGETLSTIARDYGVTVDAIVEANALTDPDTLRVGQKLFIPQ